MVSDLCDQLGPRLKTPASVSTDLRRGQIARVDPKSVVERMQRLPTQARSLSGAQYPQKSTHHYRTWRRLAGRCVPAGAAGTLKVFLDRANRQGKRMPRVNGRSGASRGILSLAARQVFNNLAYLGSEVCQNGASRQRGWFPGIAGIVAAACPLAPLAGLFSRTWHDLALPGRQADVNPVNGPGRASVRIREAGRKDTHVAL